MADTYRLKIKIGEHEFEAEGPATAVQEQFQLFKEMVASAPVARAAHPQSTPLLPSPVAPPPMPPATEEPNVDNSLHKIMQFDDAERVVSLTIRPESVEDAILLILLGQKWMLSNETITGAVIMDGLTATGGLPVSRIDRLLEKLGREGNVIVIGQRRGKRYRLTNAGVNKAKELANALIVLVP
jgi:hypothetical protein